MTTHGTITVMGVPARGVEVYAVRGGKVVAVAHSDPEGRFAVDVDAEQVLARFVEPAVGVRAATPGADGAVQQRVNVPSPGTGQPSGLRQTWTVNLPHDGWMLIEAGWPIEDEKPAVDGDYAALFPGHVPMAFTNPVRIDADGDGRWRPGR